jgi:hypothetical protein
MKQLVLLTLVMVFPIHLGITVSAMPTSATAETTVQSVDVSSQQLKPKKKKKRKCRKKKCYNSTILVGNGKYKKRR